MTNKKHKLSAGGAIAASHRCQVEISAFVSTSNISFAGLRPGIYSWLKFQPEVKGDVKVILPRR